LNNFLFQIDILKKRYIFKQKRQNNFKKFLFQIDILKKRYIFKQKRQNNVEKFLILILISIYL
jgi:hypothetical protein